MAGGATVGRRAKALWQRWCRVAEVIGHVQTYLFLSLFYFVIVLPFALITRLCTDPLQLRAAPGRSGWRPGRRVEPSLESARRQA